MEMASCQRKADRQMGPTAEEAGCQMGPAARGRPTAEEAGCQMGPAARWGQLPEEANFQRKLGWCSPYPVNPNHAISAIPTAKNTMPTWRYGPSLYCWYL